jgi:hypothetical protein
MKSWLKPSLAVVLGILILLAGSGISLAKMACVKSGYTSITLNEPDDCCQHEHEHAPVSFEEKCCDISSMHIEALQYLNSSSQNIQKSFVSIAIPAVAFHSDAYSETVSAVAREHCDTEFTSSPPIRILTRTFLI